MKDTAKVMMSCPACGRAIAVHRRTMRLVRHKPFARGHFLARQNNHTWCAGVGMVGAPL